MKKILIRFSLFISLFFLAMLSYVYFQQEKILFQKTSLPQDYVFSYKQPFKELFIETEKGAKINALHFKTSNPKGVVLYFHGRGGNLAHRCGHISDAFTCRGYDFFIMDYRGFGKSRGKLSERALCFDARKCYEFLKKFYEEDQIIIYGCSLGTGIATYVASLFDPKMLILEAPYFSILDLTPRQVPYLPSFLIPLILKYHLRTDLWILKVRSPIRIFHGTDDELVPFDSSLRLLKLLKNRLNAILIPIEKGKHYHLSKDVQYQMKLDEILSEF